MSYSSTIQRTVEEEDYSEFINLRRSRYRFAIKPVQIIHNKTMENSQECFDCSICLEDEIPEQSKVEIKECKHSFCGSCIIDCLDKLQVDDILQEFKCPLCRKQVETFNIKETELCKTIKNRFCKYQKQIKKIYYEDGNEDSWINYLLSWMPF